MKASKIVLGYCPTRRDVFDRNAAIALIKQYEKSGNPKKIKDPDIAAKLLIEITEFAENHQTEKGEKE